MNQTLECYDISKGFDREQTQLFIHSAEDYGHQIYFLKNISISKGLALILELGEPVPAMK